MSYQVIARKWRPQTFEEVVGQGATEQTLRNAILQNRIAHSYLFAGPRGVGKTTTARIFAKALNCIQGPTITPCNVCDPCREITAGNSIDVLEIDAASNRGIDEIRELRENVKYASVRDRHKIFIIDEVHMLTTEAFNALLKTLEEPPERVIFILATTELHKVPATILSRCQHFSFRAIPFQEILERLNLICREEQVKIGEGALNSIARAAEGSMRDAQSLLDQVIAFCGNDVTDEKVRDLLGVIPHQILEDFTAAIVGNDGKHLIALVEQLAQSGRNLQHFVRELLSHFRNLLMAKIAGPDPRLIPLTADELSRLERQAKCLSEEDLTRFFSILVTTEGELRWSSQPRLHLEMGLMKLLQVKRLLPMESLLAALRGMEKAETSVLASQLGKAPAPNPPVDEMNVAAPNQESHSPKSASPRIPGEFIEALKAQISHRSPMIASLLDHASTVKVGEGSIEIQFAGQARFHCEMLRSEENLELIREVAGTVAGKPLEIKIIQTNGPTEPSGPGSVKTGSERQKNGLLDRVKRDAAVKSFLEVFQGEITDVKEIE